MSRTIKLIRLSLGIIFLWYGMLKFFPSLSPAEALATQTIDILFFGLISPSVSIKLLAILEVGIGLGFIFGIYTRYVVFVFLGHMICTFAPLFILPELSFTQAPYAFTLVGQYIVKNVVFILAGILIYQNEVLGKTRS
ncbi:putative membrane protein [Arcobacter venerupis]|uniref:Membrane protein n=1 Tax=Arcobacter venerupis TaxID=1054033 RepID=A0AAE7B7I9_9BACT|nr:DoxX family protein [Arcobacter venerupis]QKF66828.1 putative membrane protein [Arcobacter venerupis]RWS49824.1 doxx family protein [Arcobacter venerupis]